MGITGYLHLGEKALITDVIICGLTIFSQLHVIWLQFGNDDGDSGFSNGVGYGGGSSTAGGGGDDEDWD